MPAVSAILSQYFVPGESESDQTNVMLGSGQVVAASLLYAGKLLLLSAAGLCRSSRLTSTIYSLLTAIH